MPQSPYTAIKAHYLQRYSAHIEGEFDALFCVISAHELNMEARQALQASAQRLGYDTRQCAYIVLDTPNKNTPDDALTSHDLLTIVEAIDPLCIVLADHESTKTASAGYNVALSLEVKEHLLGRGCCCFEDFEKLLTSSEGKQKAWACLKTLPHNG